MNQSCLNDFDYSEAQSLYQDQQNFDIDYPYFLPQKYQFHLPSQIEAEEDNEERIKEIVSDLVDQGDVVTEQSHEIKQLNMQTIGKHPKTSKRRKSKTSNHSLFHNYQKHLTIALKKLICISTGSNSDGHLNRQVASKIWSKFKETPFNTKRVLHFVFSAENGHSLNNPQLQKYGLLQIYENYGDQEVNKGRQYLNQLALQQLNQNKIQAYLQNRKIRNKDDFKRYLLAFKSQLQNGCFRKRLSLEHFKEI